MLLYSYATVWKLKLGGYCIGLMLELNCFVCFLLGLITNVLLMSLRVWPKWKLSADFRVYHCITALAKKKAQVTIGLYVFNILSLIFVVLTRPGY